MPFPVLLGSVDIIVLLEADADFNINQETERP
jgi:hypothetical protein